MDCAQFFSDLKALLIECAFPNELNQLAAVSNHLTPRKLEIELEKLENDNCEIHIINMKPMYRQSIMKEIGDLGLDRIKYSSRKSLRVVSRVQAFFSRRKFSGSKAPSRYSPGKSWR